MQERLKQKAIELLTNGTADRVLGWKTGEFCYDLTPAVFTTGEEVEKNFVFGAFAGANLSKYLIAESRKGGKVAVFLKPCDSYSFTQLLKEHRILRENVHVVGIACDGTCDIEKVKALGCEGITAVSEAEGKLAVQTLYGTHTIPKKDVLLERCVVCKSKKIVTFDELIGEQGEECESSRFDEVAKLETMTPEERFAFWREELSRCIRCKSAYSTTRIPVLRTRRRLIPSRKICSISSARSMWPPAVQTVASAAASAHSGSLCTCSTASS